MSGVGQAGGLSRAVDLASAAIFAAATGYSVLALSESQAGSAAAGAAGFLAALTILDRISDAPRFALPEFMIGDVEADESDPLPELLLTELTELLLTETVAEPGELLLEDRLDRPGDDSRVIRLFDPSTLPTAGELHERIERHVEARERAAYPDATAELHRALADLRGSLR